MDSTEDLREFELACVEVLERLSEAEPNGSWIVARHRPDGSNVVLFSSPGAEIQPGMQLVDLPLDVGYHHFTDLHVRVTLGASTHDTTVPTAVTTPIQSDDGQFGFLAGLLDEPFGDHRTDRLSIELMAGLISRVLSAELEMVEEQRLRIHAAEQALTDPMTRAGNRRAWEIAIDQEERRCRRYGHEACVLIVDLDGLKECNDAYGHAAGDALIIRAVQILRNLARDVDTVARLGGDEFGVLMAETDRNGGERLRHRVVGALAAELIPASAGLAHRNPAVGLIGAWQSADADMYRIKQDHHRRAAIVTPDRSAG
ncbi:MAG TPA: GGDEF domain-containing protein [Acidimicrobiales bacterium]|nr:GGDEF domain-containing protein [Acidimicrobiales bacterium]